MCERNASMSFFSSAPRPLTLDELENFVGGSVEEGPTTKIRHKFVPYEVTNENIHNSIRDLQMPFELLRHFDEKRKANTKFLAPLKYFGLKVGVDPKRNTIFNSVPDQETSEAARFKGKIRDLLMVLNRKKEKRQSLTSIPDLLAENLEGMSCETYFDISRDIWNFCWHFEQGTKRAQELKTRPFRQTEAAPTVYNFVKLSEVFENIFYDGFKKIGEPDFSQLSGPNFVNFLKWRGISHSGPFMHKFGSKAASVAVYVMGQYECLKIFNFGKPLHGLYLFEADEFKNWSKKFETLPIWFLNPPEIITNDIQKLVSGFERQTFI